MTEQKQLSRPAIVLNHEFFITDEDNNQIVTARVYKRHDVLWLTNLWVNAAYRRQGLATLMMKRVLAEFGHKTLYLDVFGYTNQPLSDLELARWYTKFGFQQDGSPGVMVRKGVPLLVSPTGIDS